MEQEFIVAWVNNVGKDRFRVFDSLTEAEEFMNGLNLFSSYAYLSVVIKKQQIYCVHQSIVGIIKPTKPRGSTDET